MRLHAIALLIAVLMCGCAHRRPRERDAATELREFYYTDDEGLQVLTTAARGEVPLRTGDALMIGYVHDHIDAKPVDTVSSASTKLNPEGLKKDRVEMSAAYEMDVSSTQTPMFARATGRFSYEHDYLSFSGELRFSTELLKRNLQLSGFLGYGHDTVNPRAFHEDDAGRWPDSHQRVLGGLSLRQLLSARADLAAGFGVSWQTGALQSPYRRALVLSGPFGFASFTPQAERHPGERVRVNAFVGSAIYLGAGVALHLRLGGYADTWEVLALVPEMALVAELGRNVLLSVGYRYYVQSRASFYQERYRSFTDLAAAIGGWDFSTSISPASSCAGRSWGGPRVRPASSCRRSISSRTSRTAICPAASSCSRIWRRWG